MSLTLDELDKLEARSYADDFGSDRDKLYVRMVIDQLRKMMRASKEQSLTDRKPQTPLAASGEGG